MVRKPKTSLRLLGALRVNFGLFGCIQVVPGGAGGSWGEGGEVVLEGWPVQKEHVELPQNSNFQYFIVPWRPYGDQFDGDLVTDGTLQRFDLLRGARAEVTD